MFTLKFRKKRNDKIEDDVFNKNKTALIYSLKAIKINKEDILNTNNHAMSILTSIFENEKTLSNEIEKIEESGKNLYASIQVVLEAADVLSEYATTSNKNIHSGIDEVNSIIEQLSKFTENISNILHFIKPFSTYSEQIGSITDIIFNIAQMTESAARNAGIKAYHAGEYGRGFEVIADRMLLLANKTFKLTQKIPVGINKIQDYTRSIIENIDNTKKYADNLKSNIGELTFRLKNIEDNLNDIVRISNKVKDFVSLQETSKKEITKLNQNANDVINKNISSGKRLSSIVNTQTNIKNLIIIYMEQIDALMEVFNNRKFFDSSVSNELKFFNKIESQLLNNKDIGDQIISIINEFIDFNEEQKNFIDLYKKNIDAIEDNERMILNNIQDIDDEVSLLVHSVNKFNDDVANLSNEISQMKNHIQDFISLFHNVSMNLKFILNTSNELKELSEQTRLLSLYASIEAARAGKFQSSLSVIVAQTKELIKRAAEASQDIQKIVNDMQGVINKVDEIVKTEFNYSKDIENSIKRGGNIIDEITMSSNNLKSLINEIYDAINSQTDIRNRIIDVYRNITKQTNMVNEKANDLFAILKQDLAKNENDIEMIKGIKESIQKRFEIIENKEKNSFTFHISDLPRHWLPYLISDSFSNKALRLFHNGLVRFGKEADIVPAIARSWSINADATEWIFYLKNNVYFHDGTLLTAHDVKATYKKVLKTYSASFINMIKGAQDYMENRVSDVEGMEIIDDFTIKFTLEYSYIPFISNLAVTPLVILKKEMVNYSDEQMQREHIGCGPYKLEYFDKKENIIYGEAYKNYFDGESFVDRIKIIFGREKKPYDMLLNREIDMASLSIKEYNEIKTKEVSYIKLFYEPSLDIQYIGFNMIRKNPIAKNKYVRQAMNYATDKIFYINETMSGDGIPAKGIFPPGLSSYNKLLKGYEFDIEKARELMSRAGFPDGIPDTFEFTCSKNNTSIKRAELLKQMWERIGIKIKIKPLEWGELLNKMHNGHTEIFMMGWAGDTGEPDNFLYPLFHSNSKGSGGNDTFYSNKEVDRLIEKARKTNNPIKRNELYQKIEKLIVEDAPMIFMSHNYNRIGLNDKFFGFYVHPLSAHPIHSIWKKWSIDE